MGTPNFSRAVYDCATACAIRRQKKKCKIYFGHQCCNRCKLDIRQYVDADPRHVKLFMLQAEGRAYDLMEASSPNHLLFLIGITVCLVIASFFYKDEHDLNAQFGLTPTKSVTAPVNKAIPNSNVHMSIVNALNEVSRAMRYHVDVNNDGLTNCIDAAVTFYKYFPDKSKVCIEVNYNPSTGMHHLFNCVLIDGVWRAIEPQAYFKNHKSYYMKDVWGSQYDNSKNRDVTNDYIKFVK